MTRQQCLTYARGLFAGAKVSAVAKHRRYAIDVEGVEVATGNSWADAYGDLRRRADARERDLAAQRERLSAQP